MEPYIQKCGHSNIENTRIITGGISMLFEIICHIQDFTKGSIKYIGSAFHEIKMLGVYLKGGYNLNNHTLTPDNKMLIRFFEKALPGLAGKKSRGV